MSLKYLYPDGCFLILRENFAGVESHPRGVGRNKVVVSVSFYHRIGPIRYIAFEFRVKFPPEVLQLLSFLHIWLATLLKVGTPSQILYTGNTSKIKLDYHCAVRILTNCPIDEII